MNIFKKILRWFVLYLIFLEIFLRLGGLIFIWHQDFKNRMNLKNDDYRILCMGDSMTVVSDYPAHLQQILNAKQNKVHYTVINKGQHNAAPDYILEHLTESLETYQPRMVILMSGLISQNIPHPSVWNWPGIILNKLEVFHLGKSLISKVIEEIKSIKFYKPKSSQSVPDTGQQITIDAYLHAMETNVALSPSSENYVILGLLYRAAYKNEQSLQCYIKAMQLNPNNYEAWRLIIEHYINAEDLLRAVANIVQFLDRIPNSEKLWAYSRLYECYVALHKEEELRAVYEHAIINLPENEWGYIRLGEILFQEGDYGSAKALFSRQIIANPKAVGAYNKLADCFVRDGDLDSAKHILQKGIEINPDAKTLQVQLAGLHLDSKEPEIAVRILEEVAEINPGNPQSLKAFRYVPGVTMNQYELLVEAYALNQDSKRSTLLRNALNQHKHQQANTYAQIAKVLAEKNVLLVIVQYPMKNFDHLKEDWPRSKKIHFVDNEASFKHAVAQEGYFVYFLDRTGGEFGHLTAKGSQMLAENISKTVLNLHD